jgi:hypothetical protein
MAYVSSATTTQENSSLPQCPECGGLQCLCRPRFFAGQLLTEEDLNRLDDYIVKKNKLHNRYLHGWGVVCGLDVVCNPCVDQSAQTTIKQVTVKAGYALSPCGEDIIVYGDTSVDIGKLIQTCRQVQRQVNCEPPWPTSSTECQEQTEDWVLALCYAEKPSRGITALKGSSASDCGASKSSCNCQSNSTSKSVYQTSTRSAPAQCESTLTCEGYSWRVYKAPPAATTPAKGAMVDRFLDCAKPLVAQLERLRNPLDTPQRKYNFCCTFKQTLKDFLVGTGYYNCSVAEQLATVTCPALTDPPDSEFDKKWNESIQQLVKLAGEFMRYCLCTALLPPCPEPVYDNCVPLATLTVRRTDYRIMDICTWRTRRFAVTLPAIGYWLSWLPLMQLPFEQLAAVCCKLPECKLPEKKFTLLNQYNLEHFGDSNDPWGHFKQLWQALDANRLRDIDVRNLVLAILGATASSEPTQFMSETEFQNPLQFLLLNQLVEPLLREVNQTRQSAVVAPPPDLAALREAVNNLQSTVAEQQSMIAALKSQRQRKT